MWRRRCHNDGLCIRFVRGSQSELKKIFSAIIKRHSAVSDVAEVFHLRVPVDYMHQVFAGFTGPLLFVVRNKTCKSGLVEIFSIVLSI